MSTSSQGGAGSELEAMLQRRRAKIDQPTEASATKNDESDDVQKSPVDESKIIKPSVKIQKQSPTRKTPELKGKFIKPTAIKTKSVESGGKNVGGVEKEETDARSEFERNIAIFNAKKKKVWTPKTTRVSTAPAFLNEKALPQAPLSAPSKSTVKPYGSSFRPVSKSPLANAGSSGEKKPANLIGSPGRKTPTNINIGSPSPATPKSFASPSRRTTPKSIESPSRKSLLPSRFFHSPPDKNIPNIVVTQPIPPPPPPPPPNPPPVRSPNQPLSKSVQEEENKITTPSSSSSKKTDGVKQSLPSSHVQAMKLKFLLKNPKPTPLPTPTTPSFSSVQKPKPLSTPSAPSNSVAKPTSLGTPTTPSNSAAFSPKGTIKSIETPSSPKRDMGSLEKKVANLDIDDKISDTTEDFGSFKATFAGNDSEGQNITTAVVQPKVDDDFAKEESENNDDNEEKNVDINEDNPVEAEPEKIVGDAPLKETIEPVFNAFAPSFGTEKIVVDNNDTKENASDTGNNDFPAFFENNHEMFDPNDENNDDGTSTQEALFGDWSAKPSFAVEAVANNEPSTEDASGGWKWNNDPFDESEIGRSDSNKAQVNAGGSDEVYDDEDGDVYVPPPTFGFESSAAFVPEEEHFEDDSDKETLMTGDIINNANEVVIKAYDVPIAASSLESGPSFSCQNPLTENIILCRKLGKKWYIDEVETSDESSITKSVEISCLDIKQQLHSSLAIIPCGVQDVQGIAAGVHFQNDRPRVRVAVLMNLFAFGASQPVCVLAIWQWGYGNIRPVCLQTVIAGPSLAELHEYDPRSLSVSHGLFFVSGSVNSRPTVMICKPHEQMKWVPSFLGSADSETARGSKITHMKLCPGAKLLALSKDDGSLSVWSFEDRIPAREVTNTSADKLTLVCVLEAISPDEENVRTIFDNLESKTGSAGEDDVNAKEDRIDDVDQKCQSLSWMPTNDSSPVLLAASFENAVVVYNLSTSAVRDKSENARITAVAGARIYNGDLSRGSMQTNVQWIRRGDNLLPFLSTSLLYNGEMKMHIGSIMIVGSEIEQEETMSSISTISQASFPKRDSAMHNFYGGQDICTLLAHCNRSLTSFVMSSRFSSGLCPTLLSDSMNVASESLGLSSTGDHVHSYHDVLHVHTTLSFKGAENTTNGFPVINHWLLRTIMGDEKAASKDDESMLEDFPKGGASTSVICCLRDSKNSINSFAPRRITRNESGNRCIVFFKSTTGPNVNAIDGFATINLQSDDSSRGKFDIYQGRDAAFLSNSEAGDFLVLDRDGIILRKCSLTSIGDDLESSEGAVRIFKDGSANCKNLTVCRFFLLTEKILFLCSRKFDGKQCLFVGSSIAAMSSGNDKALVKRKTSKLWFEKGEGFLSCAQLTFNNKESEIIIAIATTSRVLLVSVGTSVHILTETRTYLACENLSPLGSSVAFVERGNGGTFHLNYLSAFEGNQKGCICTFSAPGNIRNCQILGVRPDRVIFLPMRYTVEDASAGISVPGPITKPALLLEPLVANALGENVDNDTRQSILHTVLERFGPKLSATPHGENEGVGTLGAGITAKVYAMLGTSLNAYLQKGEEKKILTPWVPNILKSTRIERSLDYPKIQKNIKNRRNLLLEVTKNAPTHGDVGSDSFWSKGFDDTKHVWCQGPFGNNEELLLLDSIEEWTGKHRPVTMGKMGAELAAETGEKTLQNILAAAAKASDGVEMSTTEDLDNQSAGSRSSWVQKIGEGRNNEDNLSLYLRFSEGADTDYDWKESGLQDISRHRNKVELVNKDVFVLEDTTSNVDEGEHGKVRPLCDLVFQRDCGFDDKCGLLLPVPRGNALDVGIFHSTKNSSRQRATLEFWCYIPNIPGEIVLARRSVSPPDEDSSEYCCVNKKDGLLWELVALPSGRLQFRTSHGSLVTSNYDMRKDLNTTVEVDPAGKEDKGLLSLPEENGFGGWNHISLSFSCRDMDSMMCNVALRMKGNLISSSDVIFDLPPLEADELSDFDRIDSALRHSVMLLGLGAPEGLRFTEIRLWACKRASEDIKMMMYEYLDAAKTKKKFSVSIRGKGFTKEPKTSGLIMPPPIIEKPKLTSGRPLLQLPGSARGVATDDDASHGIENEAEISFADFASVDSASVGSASAASLDDEETENNPYIEEFMSRAGPEVDAEKSARSVRSASSSNVANLEKEDFDKNVASASSLDDANLEAEDSQNIVGASSSSDDADFEVESPISLVITKSPLISEEVRKSAAAAIIRGPPAARHLNGNRGGLRLSDESSKGIGNICITGSEKTVIFSPLASVPAKSYPIGASGAIISDHIDGTEYLCCFLARDKRIVVFDLNSKIVVVELQMTTKLNYWRFLPGAAHGDTLVFLLITPIGGFHWMPLEESPRPKQIWRRGRDLQGKKIISYEEGGSNGLVRSEMRSTIALILASPMNTPNDSTEAWILSVGGGLMPFCLSEDVLGASLLKEDSSEVGAFEPLAVVISAAEDVSTEKVNLDIFKIAIDEELETIFCGEKVTHQDITFDSEDLLDAPTMAMGTSPLTFSLCCNNYVIVILRDLGYLVAYRFEDNQLELVNDTKLGSYVVDAAVKVQSESGGIDIVTLVCDESNVRDGRIVTISIN